MIQHVQHAHLLIIALLALILMLFQEVEFAQAAHIHAQLVINSTNVQAVFQDSISSKGNAKLLVPQEQCQ